MAMPLYVMIDAIGLNGSLLGLILASSFFPFGAFLSYLYFTSVLPQDLVPNVLLADPSQSILSIGIEAFYGQETALIAIVMIIPSVLLFLAANKMIARGIFSGAVKE